MARRMVLDARKAVYIATLPGGLALVPALGRLLKNGKPCALCAVKKRNAVDAALRQISALPPDKRAELKKLLKVDQLEFTLPGHSHSTVI